MPVFHRFELGHQGRALIDGDRAAPAEAAAGSRIDHSRRLAAVGARRDRERCSRVGHGREQELGVRMLGVGQHGLDRAGLDDPAGVHHHHPVGDVAGAGDVVGDVEERDALPSRAGRPSR